MRLLILTGSPQDNQIGRTASLLAIAAAAGVDPRVVTLSPPDTPLWEPVKDSPIQDALQFVDVDGLASEVAAADVALAAKPRASTLGALAPICRRLGVPLVVDIDDPDLEVLRGSLLSYRALRRLPALPRRLRSYRELRHLAHSLPVITSNPVLQRAYGGTLIPHARPDLGAGTRPGNVNGSLSVAFIGTPLRHKGIHLLRKAVAELADEGFHLTVTGLAPRDGARPWETWTGPLPTHESMNLLRNSDIVALPSIDKGWGRGQLPMKLMDAMLAGRAIAVSDLEPLAWALGEAGIVFKQGSQKSLTDSLRQFRDRELRMSLGAAARARGLALFTPEASAETFRNTLTAATLE